MVHQPIENLEVFALFEEVATWAWEKVASWEYFEKRTVGDQLVRAADSINANLVEGDGRYTTNDSLRFFYIARASARETELWITRAISRGLLDEPEGSAKLKKLKIAMRLLNNLIEYRRRSKEAGFVKEDLASYNTGIKMAARGEG